MTSAKLRVARRMLDAGWHTMTEVAETIGVGRATLYRYLEPDCAAPEAATRSPRATRCSLQPVLVQGSVCRRAPKQRQGLDFDEAGRPEGRGTNDGAAVPPCCGMCLRPLTVHVVAVLKCSVGGTQLLAAGHDSRRPPRAVLVDVEGDSAVMLAASGVATSRDLAHADSPFATDLLKGSQEP